MNFFDRTNPIGIFDSGIGGLTVVKEIDQYLPNENIVYFGDTARVPYGSKSNATVIEYAIQDAQFLMKKNIKLLIVACNTVSSIALDQLRERFSIPVIGMIEPGTKAALKVSVSKRIGIIGTRATIGNKAYSASLLEKEPAITAFEKACPLFVPLAEEGWLDHKATRLIAEEYLSEIREKGIDTLILGCTHYPILKDTIQQAIGSDVKLIDSGTAAASEVETYLNGIGLRNTSYQQGYREFYVSDLPSKFEEVAGRFLGKPVKSVHKVDLEELTK